MVRALVKFPVFESLEDQHKTFQSLIDELFRQLNGTLFKDEDSIVRKLFELAWKLHTGELADFLSEPIVGAIEKLANDCGYCARAHAGAADWLWDKVWFKKRETQAVIDSSNQARVYNRASEWAKIDGLRLVCECEKKYESDEVLKDFMKLVFVESDLRLFVYQYHDRTADLCRNVTPTSTGKRYLLVGFSKNRKEFQVDSYIA